MASSYSHLDYYGLPSQPIDVPIKDSSAPLYSYGQTDYSRLSSSPPEVTDASSSGGGTYDLSAISGSYAASASDYDSASTGLATVDLLELMNERLQSSYDPITMDKSLVQQTQTSGELNAKTQQLLELQALAAQQLAAMQATMAEGIKAAKEVQHDLDWTQKKVTSLNKRAARKYPEEYSIAQDRYPLTMDY